MRKMISLLLLAGCWTPIYPNHPIERLPEYKAAWLEAGLPDPGECKVRLGWVDDAGIARYCRANASGCLVSNQDHWLALVHVDAESVIPHEVGHAFSACAGLGLDPDHTEWGVWCLYLSKAGGINHCHRQDWVERSSAAGL